MHNFMGMKAHTALRIRGASRVRARGHQWRQHRRVPPRRRRRKHDDVVAHLWRICKRRQRLFVASWQRERSYRGEHVGLGGNKYASNGAVGVWKGRGD